ncbi:hypothetical protein GpartN1_g5373.t1 [Galdieria partita]|uniref:Epidermal growth factor receptor substrate 15 n=1 Tax=Galdieria partita TaxID=83374 RepID=A0A9C7USF3_9RHOD|nr:hypothetical protein GpartN1_g5373.t1 [Galdieria partita]
MNPYYYYQGGPGMGGPPPQSYGASPSYPPSQYGRGPSGFYGAAPYGMYQPPPPSSSATPYAMSSPYGMYPPPQQQYPMYPGYGAMRQQAPPNALPALTFEQSGNESKQGKEQGIRKYLQLSQQEEQQYSMLFREASKGSGTVLGRDAVQFFGRAVNVDRATLRKIWDIADYRSAGELRREEFYIALRLLAIAQLGYEVSKKTLKQFIGKELIPELKGYSMEPAHPPIPVGMYPTNNVTHPSPTTGIPASYPNQTMQQDFWELKPADCKKIDHQFAEMDKPKKGFLAGSKVAGKLAESGLPRPVLKRIWELADVTLDGKLDYIEFRIAMALVNGSKQGYPLPPSLPASLHPERLKRIPFARKTGKAPQSSIPDVTSRTYNPSSSVIYASYGPGAAAWQENPSDLVLKAREADEELERTKLELSQVEKEYQDLEEETHHLRSQLDSKKWEMDYLRNTLQERQKGSKPKSPPSSVAPSISPNVSHPSRQPSGIANHHGNYSSSASDIFSAPVSSTKPAENSAAPWNDFSALPPPSNTTILDNAYSSALNDTDDFLDRPYVPEGTWNQNSVGVYSNVSRENPPSSNNMNDWAQYYPVNNNSGGDMNPSRSRGLSASKKHE